MSRGGTPDCHGQRLAEAAEAGSGGVTTALRAQRLRGEGVRRWAPS